MRIASRSVVVCEKDGLMRMRGENEEMKGSGEFLPSLSLQAKIVLDI